MPGDFHDAFIGVGVDEKTAVGSNADSHVGAGKNDFGIIGDTVASSCIVPPTLSWAPNTVVVDAAETVSVVFCVARARKGTDGVSTVGVDITWIAVAFVYVGT